MGVADSPIWFEQTAEVPCGSCVACCRSSMFIQIEPDEKRTIARIPRELLFPAPGRPKGHWVMGYDEAWRCPMLVEERCSIYEDPPRTCRMFDCRVMAAGLGAGSAVEVKAIRLMSDQNLP